MQQGVIEGFRLSSQQESLWYLAGGDGAAMTQCALGLPAELSAEVLARSLEKLVAQHEILRTGFSRLPGMELPLQVITEEPTLDFRQEEVSTTSVEELERCLDAERRAPVDLAAGSPLHTVLLIPREGGRRVLLITLPTLCADALSLDNLAAELAALCTAALCAGGLPAEEEEALQFLQFSEWQHSLVEGEEAEDGQAFWQRQDTGEVVPPTLPGESSPVRDAERRLAHLVRPVPEPLASACESYAAAEEVSTASIWLAAWACLLGKLAVRSEVRIKVGFSGRSFPELNTAIGPFARSIPLLLHCPLGRSFRRTVRLVEDLRGTAESWLDLCPAAGVGDGVAQVSFESRTSTLGGDGEFAVLLRRSAADEIKLGLTVVAGAKRSILELGYDPACYEEAEMAQPLERLEQLLRAGLEQPSIRLDAIDLVTGEEALRLAEWQGGGPAAPPKALFETFAAAARSEPSALALVDGGRELTRGQVLARAEALARRLQGLGVGPETRVAFLFHRSAEQIIALLGVLRAGGAYVPLDPWQPDARLAGILADAGARWVVTDDELAARLPEKGPAVVLLEDGSGQDGSEQDSAGQELVPEVSLDHLAYVLYTSGSSGRPKGVLVTRRSVANLAAALEAAIYHEFDAGKPLRVAINAPLSFDASVKQVIQLLRGHALVIVPEDVRTSGEEFARWLAQQRVDVLDSTPSHLRVLFDSGLGADGSRAPHLFLIGGEAIDDEFWQSLVERAAESSPPQCFMNVYGPTECTVDATVARVEAGAPNIGRPILGVHVGVQSTAGVRQPPAVPGELCIGGAGVAQGYLGRPALTAERFVPDPTSDQPGARLYRTGDRVRYGPAGGLEYLGRLDRQVKLRGIRLELGEIEALLEQHPAVREAAVTVREDGGGTASRRLLAYAVPRWRYAAVLEGYPRYELPNGMAVAHQNRNETDYLYEEIWRNRCYVQHGITLPPGACIFDVGANIGMFTLFVHQECDGPRVYAFEPLEPIFETLRVNCELYGPDTRLFAFGLSHQAHEVRFTYYPRYTMMSGQTDYARPESEGEVIKRFLENAEQEGSTESATLLAEADEILAGRFLGEEQEVRLRRLSEVLREENVEHIDLLKIDVQRGEFDVLRGIDEEDWPKIDQVVLEVHDAPDDATAGRVQKIEEFLRARGFEVTAEQDPLLVGTDRHNVYARHRRVLAPADTPEVEPPGGEQKPSVAFPGVITSAALREHLHQHLPEFMLPSAVVLLDELPLDRRGKVAYQALPAPEEVAADQGGQVEAPRTLFEEMLAGIWSELLGISEIGSESNFFELGGHSLLATQLMSRVREAFEVELPLRNLFENPTLEGLAAALAHVRSTGEGTPLPPIEPAPRGSSERGGALSFAQQRLWFIQQLDPTSVTYNSLKSLVLDGPLDVKVIRRTLYEVVRRHEVLRTTFEEVAGKPLLCLHPARPLPLPIVDLEGLAEDRRQDVARQLISLQARRPYDLERGPLLRTLLFRLTEEEHVMVLLIHHIVSDAWSIGVLVREVAEIYNAYRLGEPSPFAELPVQYSDFAHWQQYWLAGEVLEKQVDWWRHHLAGELPTLELPTDHPRPERSAREGESVTFRLTPALGEKARELSLKKSATLFMTLLAAFKVLLFHSTQQSDVLVGVANAGRSRREVDDLIGFFINMLVLRTDLDGNPSFEELLGRVRNTALGAFAHQDVPFERLVEELQPERSSNRSPFFQIAFGLQNAPREELELPGLKLRPFGVGRHSANYDLTLWMYEGEDGSLAANWSFDVELFERSTIARLHEHYELILEQVLSRPETRLAAVRLETETEAAEREQQKKSLKKSGRARFQAAKARTRSRR